MINVGIIGAGFIVPIFIEATKAVGGFRYVGIAARKEETLKGLKEKYGIQYYALDNDTVLSDPKIDVIYVGVPNDLHYEIAKKALLNNKHVIMEKPFTPTYAQAKELVDLAKQKKKIIFDAVTLLHMPNYAKIKDLLKEIGTIRVVDLSFCQYSSRYDKFRAGTILPALDYRKAGGALMDLGIYNIDFVMGLFGVPKSVQYYPNIVNKIDTSGVLIMDYGKFKVNSIAAKDCKAPMRVSIQGEDGYIASDYSSSTLTTFRYVDRKSGKCKEYSLNKHIDIGHYHEYAVLKKLINDNDLKTAQEFNRFTLKTIKVLEEALKSGGVKFVLSKGK